MDESPASALNRASSKWPYPAKMNRVAYEDVRDSLSTGLIALARPSSLEGRIIVEETHVGHPAPWQRYSHVTMLGWCSEVLMLGETRQHADARVIAAGEEFRRWPGYYDIYRVRGCVYDPQAAWEFMLRAAGSRYGWNHVWRVAARRGLGHWIPPIANSDNPRWPRDCSALVHRSVRNARGPVLLPWDCDVTPQHFCDPGRFAYLYTIASAAPFRARR